MQSQNRKYRMKVMKQTNLKHFALMAIVLGFVIQHFAQDNLALIDLNQFSGKKIPRGMLEKINVHFTGVPLEEAINTLSTLSDVIINYNQDLLPKEEMITLQVDDTYALEALLIILKNTDTIVHFTSNGQLALESNASQSMTGGSSSNITVSGRVIDKTTAEPLPGANVLIMGTNFGSSSDIEGVFYIHNVPPGVYTVKVKYIGYKEEEMDILIRQGDDVFQEFEMEYAAVEGEVVVVTAQAKGQMEAINQQIASQTVTNIVSSTKIQELPEANAAEAVGRLPGVSLERSGGEGTKVMIRGMGSKYTKIQIDGVDMTATGETDRSADLSMISPYMLEGIELTKSVMANQEATATGGIVNFKIKKAPEEPSFNVIAQGGSNNLRDSYSDYKVAMGGSNRFFENKLGLYAQIDYEHKDAGSQQLGGVWFSQENEETPVRTNSVQLMDIFRNVERLGGSLVLDFDLPSTEIKMSNFYSHINREETRHINNYGYTQQGFSINYNDIPERWLTVMTNSLQIDSRWKNWVINSIISHSYSENVLPARISSTNRNSPMNPFSSKRGAGFNVNLDPETIPDSLVIPINDVADFMHLGDLDHEESKTNERDIAGELNLSYNFQISDQIQVKLNWGGKYKYKTKSFDQMTLEMSGQAYRNLVYENFKNELSTRTKEDWLADDQKILLYDFLDPDYKGEHFLDGKYQFSPVFDKQKFRRIHELGMKTYDPNDRTRDYWTLVFEDFIESSYNDYKGNENYHAFYIMPEIDLFSRLTLVPGIRYESNRTEYTGYRGNRLGVLQNYLVTPVDTVTTFRENEFLLPMIQAIYRPVDWLNIRVGYTHTLQRPDYNHIVPGWLIGFKGTLDNLGNFRLKPELAKNLDFQVSLYSNKIGLFTAGVFHKEIRDMIFWTGQTVILDTAYFELPTITYRQRAAYATNNSNKAYNYGFELEWQSNFWYLPGFLSGLVLNINYTRNESKAKYLRTVIKTEIDPITYQATLINEDTTFTNPMINQPDHLLNLTIGYDYKGFSIRGAMRYKSRIFTSNSWYEKLRGYSVDFYRYDLSIKQKLPIEGLEFFMNINNLTNEVEQSVINYKNFTSYLEDYGRNANIGFRYRL